MSFGWPIALLGLILVALALIAYIVVQHRRRRYVVRGPTTVDTQGGAEALHRLKHHWCLVASRRLTAPTDLIV